MSYYTIFYYLIMNSNQIRDKFLDFFKSKEHKIVSSAPMVIKDDPSLMFTNAGMNQFKDIFLGNAPIISNRIADSQKCLRVSGKHNDLEEVGHDTYHHTMFEMLGNWSFGDYFKEEAINWAWELLVVIFKIPKDRLYATVFEGSEEDKLKVDDEAIAYWKKYLDDDRIILGSKKDNFWEMGDTGPCGPCSEVHIDIRSDAEREKTDGRELVNKDHPEVIEIWNLVFIQFNRRANGELELLPKKHVDTGMGFERLCMVVQEKKSNYDTDIFQPLIKKISELTNIKYGINKESDIAMRVISDHLRTIAFSIADGQLPSNNKAGYVIRRILRRAVRYAYTFLNQKEAFMYKLTPVLSKLMGNAYPELIKQSNIIKKVIIEEEQAFLRTLDTGINRLEHIIKNIKIKDYKVVNGKEAFELYDTFGFPLDLTELILKENNLLVSKREFDIEMEKQKSRSRNASNIETHDWNILLEDDIEEFIGYDYTEADIKITRYRKLKTKKEVFFQLVFNYTPFYAESGGQLGDKGYIIANDIKTEIYDTKKEHNVIVHLVKELPNDIEQNFKAVVHNNERKYIESNHTATHLLHQALREVLGTHVEQKGSLVESSRLRFDFAHFQKLSDNEILDVEQKVNEKIRMNIPLTEKREIPINEAKNMGAMALFGEKYGDIVRVIKFDKSVELCGGTHVKATGNIGFFKIFSESAIAAGIRRIEAITSLKAEQYINSELIKYKEISAIFKSSKNVAENIKALIDENNNLKKQIEIFNKERVSGLKQILKNEITNINGINVITKRVNLSAHAIKDMAFQLRGELDDLVLILGAEINKKANLTMIISDNLVKDKKLNAGKIIRKIAKEVQGGGGGQAFYATAGGTNPNGIEKSFKKAIEILQNS